MVSLIGIVLLFFITPMGVVALGLLAWWLYGVGKMQLLWWVGVGAGGAALAVLVFLYSAGKYFGQPPTGGLPEPLVWLAVVLQCVGFGAMAGVWLRSRCAHPVG